MTSEVLIMNKMGLVLAADSAATVEQINDQGATGASYFKSANKLFQLSCEDRANIGLMVYGSSEIMGVPWELVVKSFRHKKSGKMSFGTVEECATEFFKFLKVANSFFAQDIGTKNFQQTFISKLVHLSIIWSEKYENNDAQISKYEQDFCKEAVDEEASLFKQDERKEKLRDHFDQMYEEYKKTIIAINEKTKSNLRVAKITFGKACFEKLLAKFEGPESGVVIAGFGSKEEFPASQDFMVQGFVFEKLASRKGSTNYIQPYRNAYVKGFAQSSMLNLIVQGVDKSFLLEQLYDTLIKNKSLMSLIANGKTALSKEEKKNIVETIGEIAKGLTEAFAMKAYYSHSKPFLDVVSVLSVQELGELAESLVDLESLKEKVSRTSQSVGGPIDVAAITKNEGLVWLQRKHFFSESLNPRYFKNL